MTRFSASVAAVSPYSIAVFGGFKNGVRANDGYVLNIEQSSVKAILGSSSDICFISCTPVKQISSLKHVTVVSDAAFNVQLV